MLGCIIIAMAVKSKGSMARWLRDINTKRTFIPPLKVPEDYITSISQKVLTCFILEFTDRTIG